MIPPSSRWSGDAIDNVHFYYMMCSPLTLAHERRVFEMRGMLLGLTALTAAVTLSAEAKAQWVPKRAYSAHCEEHYRGYGPPPPSRCGQAQSYYEPRGWAPPQQPQYRPHRYAPPPDPRYYSGGQQYYWEHSNTIARHPHTLLITTISSPHTAMEEVRRLGSAISAGLFSVRSARQLPVSSSKSCCKTERPRYSYRGLFPYIATMGVWTGS